MKRAFTAIELIIVVAILLILMGMLMPVISGARARAKERLARREMDGICMALERYFADTGQYPPDNSDYSRPDWQEGLEDVTLGEDDPAYPPFAGSLYYYLCGPDGRGFQVPGDTRIYGPYIEFTNKQLRRRGGICPEVVDPWGNSYIYEEHRSFFASKDVTEKRPAVRQQLAVQRRAHNKMRYDLFSMGANKKLDVTRHDMEDNNNDGTEDEANETAPGEKRPDDVCNW